MPWLFILHRYKLEPTWYSIRDSKFNVTSITYYISSFSIFGVISNLGLFSDYRNVNGFIPLVWRSFTLILYESVKNINRVDERTSLFTEKYSSELSIEYRTSTIVISSYCEFKVSSNRIYIIDLDSDWLCISIFDEGYRLLTNCWIWKVNICP